MTIRISGIILPEKKRMEIALTRVYGIGRSASQKILRKVGLDPQRRAGELSEDDAARLRAYVEEEYRTEGELRREVQQSIRHLKEIGSYRGHRHAKGLPARGQRTRTNSRTVRGNVRRTTFSGKRLLQKT